LLPNEGVLREAAPLSPRMEAGMGKENWCSAYVPNSFACKNGFIQRGICSMGPINFFPVAVDKSLPLCLREELPEHMVTDSGLPRFYRGPNG
jgi:hypothetical protein